MGKSKANEWKPLLKLKLEIEPTDVIIQSKTNTISITPLNKRGYTGHGATVILGHHKAVDGEIHVKKNTRIWTCEIGDRGAVSSIGLPEVDVTVIVHDVNK
jgi:hypothetical protein